MSKTGLAVVSANLETTKKPTIDNKKGCTERFERLYGSPGEAPFIGSRMKKRRIRPKD